MLRSTHGSFHVTSYDVKAAVALYQAKYARQYKRSFKKVILKSKHDGAKRIIKETILTLLKYDLALRRVKIQTGKMSKIC